MIRKFLIITAILFTALISAKAESYRFDLSGGKKVREGFVAVNPETAFSEETGYGFDFSTSQNM